jgi:hypothetical protein
MKNLLCLCAGLILIYLCLMNCCIAYIFLWHPFDSRHKYHSVFGTNKIRFFLVMVFWRYFYLILVQEYVIQRLLAQCLTDGSFGKQIVVEVIYSCFQRSQVLDELFPPLMQSLP